jgi:hypothetical protein
MSAAPRKRTSEVREFAVIGKDEEDAFQTFQEDRLGTLVAREAERVWVYALDSRVEQSLIRTRSIEQSCRLASMRAADGSGKYFV